MNSNLFKEGRLKDISQVLVTKGRRSTDSPLQADHYHKFYEIFYLYSGSCRYLLNDTLYSLEKGDFVFIAPGNLHHSLYHPGIICEITSLYFKEGYMLPSLFPHGTELPTHSFKGSVPGLYQDEFQLLLTKIMSEGNNIDEYSGSLITCYFNELLLFLLRHSILSEKEPSLINGKDAHIMAAAKYIYRNFQKPLTLQDAADIAGLSPTYFSKKFKTLTGMTFKEYLNYIRLKHAAAALLTTERSITDIALEYGFNDSNYFKDYFKKEYGKSPREYRKSQGN